MGFFAFCFVFLKFLKLPFLERSLKIYTWNSNLNTFVFILYVSVDSDIIVSLSRHHSWIWGL